MLIWEAEAEQDGSRNGGQRAGGREGGGRGGGTCLPDGSATSRAVSCET